MTTWRAPAGRTSWRKSGLGWAFLDGDQWVCGVCREPVRSYRYRCHPPGSPMFERCVGLAWCSGCRIYEATMVHVPRARILVDVLASLPAVERERLPRKEAALIDRLDRRGEGHG